MQHAERVLINVAISKSPVLACCYFNIKEEKRNMADTPDYNAVMSQIQDYINSYDNFEKNGVTDADYHSPTIGELDQFRKDWFYDDWQIRFRELNAFYPLGTKGVVAIPNTTFEDWLYWFQQWAIAFEQDYNAFKKLVFDTINLLEKHLEAIDKTLENHEQRIRALEGEVKQLQDEVAQLQQDVKQLQAEVAQLQQQIQQILDELAKINQEIQDLQNRVANLEKEVADLQNELKKLQDELDALKVDLAPSYMRINQDNVGALNNWHTNDNAHPNGFHLSWRWANVNDHTQGVYLIFTMNRVYNPNYTPGDFSTPDNPVNEVMSVDLSSWLQETHAQIGTEGWEPWNGSYWNSEQRAGIQMYYKMNGTTMGIYLSALYGVASMKGTGRYEIEGSSVEWYCPTS